MTDATTEGAPRARRWLLEALFTYALLLALLGFVIWESLTQLSPQVRLLPLATAVLVVATLVYSFVAQLRQTPSAVPAAEGSKANVKDPASATMASQDSMSDTYGTITSDRLTPRHAYAILAFSVYVLVTPRLNFYLATGLFVVALALALRVRWLAAVISLILALVIPAVFQFGLEMRLP